MNKNERTPAQDAAIISNSPAILCVAGPGSGKTATLVARIRRLMDDGIQPRNMAVITFTNAAAREIESRLLFTEVFARVNDSSCEQPDVRIGYCGTLHGFALRMLKRYGEGMGYGGRTSIISPESAADLLASKAKSMGCKMPIEKLLDLKSKGRPAGRLDVPQTVIAAYYDDMMAAGMLDFDFLLVQFLQLLMIAENQETNFIRQQFTHLFVDEVQDSAPIDWEIYDAFPADNKFFVGDPDQAIYGFRGGRVGAMISYSMCPGVEVIRLEQNFRSRAEICTHANRLIAHNLGRIAKETISVKGPGGEVMVQADLENEGEEVGFISKSVDNLITGCDTDPSEIAILARTNAVAATFAHALAASDIPVKKKNKNNAPNDWRLARAAVEFFLQPHNNTLAYFYVIEFSAIKMPRGPAREKAQNLLKEAESKNISLCQHFFGSTPKVTPVDVPAYLGRCEVSRESCLRVAELLRELPADATLLDLSLAMNIARDEQEEGEGVTVTTIHSAKGREWDHVFLVGFEEEIIPSKWKGVDLEEERRLAYVAVTRPRQTLVITWAKTRTASWGEIIAHSPSRFIRELME